MAAKYNDEIADNIAIVCDGGNNYNVPPLPPQSKVSQTMSISNLIYYYIIYYSFLIFIHVFAVLEKKYQVLACAESSPSVICSALATTAFHGYVSSLQPRSDVHINPTSVGFGSPSKIWREQNVWFTQLHLIYASGITFQGPREDNIRRSQRARHVQVPRCSPR